MSDTTFLTLEQVIAIHDNQIELYGGSHGIRDLSLLESAVMRPQITFGGEDIYPAIFQKASVLMHSLAMNHAFIDGNKRTATVSAISFLEINGIKLVCSQKMLVKVVLELASKKIDIEKLSFWLKSHSKKI